MVPFDTQAEKSAESFSFQSQAKNGCFHCGEECGNSSIVLDDKAFCCEGCKMVYAILERNDLCDYYSISNTPGESQKAKSGVLVSAQLDNPSIAAQLIDFRDENITKVTFSVPIMHCSSCIWLLENLYRLNKGIIESRVNFPSKKLMVTFRTYEVTLREVVDTLVVIGYPPDLRLKEIGYSEDKKALKTIYAKLGIAGFAFGNIMLLSFPEYLSIDNSSETLRIVFGYLIIALSLPVFFYCSLDYFKSAIKGLANKVVNLDVPLSLGIVVFYIRSLYEILSKTGAGYMDSFASLIFLLLIGKLFQQKTYDFLNFERSYKSYFPLSALRKKDGKEDFVPLTELKPGDRIVLRNEEIIPADSILVQGEGNIDYSFVTGEAIPVVKVAGEVVYCGGKQTGGVIEVEVIKEVSQSYLTQLWNDSVFDEKHDHTLDSLATKVSKYFTLAIITIAVGSLLYWMRSDLKRGIEAFTAVLIIACPCALAMSTPFTLGNTLRAMGRAGFYLKNALVIEKMAKVARIVFDKTGTLTELGESHIVFEGTLSEEEQKIVKSVTGNSTHPLSRRIFESIPGAANRKLVTEFEERVSKGISAVVNGLNVFIGAANHSADNTTATERKGNAFTGESRVYVYIDGVEKGYYRIRNTYRSSLRATVENLRKRFALTVLSGDNPSERETLLGIFGETAQLFFRQKPEDKLSFVKSLRKNGETVVMVGDGLNDAGALAAADIGISVTEEVGRFSPASDAILEAGAFRLLPAFFEYSRFSVKIIQISFALSFFYNLIGVSVAAQGDLSPLFAAILMPISSVTVIVFTTVSTNLYARRKGILK